jgi:hypothetical protein
MGLLNKVIAMSVLDEKGNAEEIGSEIFEKNYMANIVNAYFDASGPFNCCIFHAAAGEEVPDEILQSIEMFGKLLHIQENTFVLLFPSTIDHELLLHHLDKRFHLNIVEQFSADTPQKALECIQNYI